MRRLNRNRRLCINSYYLTWYATTASLEGTISNVPEQSLPYRTDSYWSKGHQLDEQTCCHHSLAQMCTSMDEFTLFTTEHQNEKNKLNTKQPNTKPQRKITGISWRSDDLNRRQHLLKRCCCTQLTTTVNSCVRVHLNVFNNFAESVGWTATENCSSRYGQGEACLPLLCKTLHHRHLPVVSLNTHSWTVGSV